MTLDASSRRRVAITGMGAVSGLGIGVDELWAGLGEGRSGIREITAFDTSHHRTHLAAQVPGFEAKDFFSIREQRRFSRCDQLALLALKEALERSDLLSALQSRHLAPDRLATILGAGAGGSKNGEIFYRQVLDHGLRRATPSLLLSYAPSSTTDVLAERLGSEGPRATIVTACSSSNTAIGYAAELIRTDRADVVVTGGSEGLCELTFSGFNALKAISPTPCRPFDQERDGLTLGEAGAILILEDFAFAQKRGAKILAEFLGYGLVSDAYHMTAPEPSGRGAYQAMAQALAHAGVTPSQVDYISAHGTATPHNDLAEARAICELFARAGERCTIPVSAPKSMLGHCLGACGAIEAIALVLTMQHNRLPPTIHHHRTDPECLIDCVPNEARAKKVTIGLSNSFAFGGNNTCVVLRSTEANP